MEEGIDTTDWIHVGKYRRFKGATHQLYKEGKWVTISTLETYLDNLK